MFPTQRMPELRAFAMMVNGLWRYPFLIELGTDTGESAKFFNDHGIMVCSIDVNNTEKHLRSNVSDRMMMFIKGCSHDEELADLIKVETGLVPHAVFVDASHEYEDVSKDFEVWWPRLAKGGIMGFHDICLPGVARFWCDISKDHPSVEIFAQDVESAREWNQVAPGQPSGIGVLFKE